MDPTATYLDMLSALQAGELESAREHALNLQAWLRSGGFYPPTIDREQVDHQIAEVLQQSSSLHPASKPLFSPGTIVITPGAQDALDSESVRQAVQRHLLGDWGDLDDEDRLENDRSLKEGYRLLSAYADQAGRRFWIITEADRSSTCILLPEEY